MGEGTTPSRFLEIVKLLTDAGVEFIVIGGRAESLMGSARITLDVDLCYRRSKENLERLAKTLPSLKPKLRGVPPELPCIIDAQALALGNNYTFDTTAGPLDLLGYVEPIGAFEDLAKSAETVQLGDLAVKVISLDDLIRIKQHINRPKDRDSLMHLLAIKRIRNEEKK